MNTSAWSIARRRTVNIAMCGDYLELCKPKIALLVLVVVAVSAMAASWGQPDLWVVWHAVVGTALIAASGSAGNQWIERRHDARMERTANRPIAAGRLGTREAFVFGGITFALGVAYLGYFTNPTAMIWGVLTWIGYVVVYTPLKRRTHWNTAVGAVAGALPVFIGWTATGVSLDLRAIAVFSLLFFWQFPHFMAIAWLYRRQYEQAGIRMLTVVEPTGRSAGVQAICCALALLPVSFVPAVLGPPSTVYLLVASGLGLAQLLTAIAFCWYRDDQSARRLLRASLIYLPCLLVLLALLPVL